MNDAEKYLITFILDLENERTTMKTKLRTYEGRCEQLKEDIDRLNFAITQGNAAIKRIKEDKNNGKEETT